MKHKHFGCARLPRKTKKAFIKYVSGRSVGPREVRRMGLGGPRNLCDLGPRCMTFLNRCLEAGYARGTWDYRLFD